MNRFFFIAVFVFLFGSISFAQKLSLDEIRNYYKSFNYQKVIELSETLLRDNELSSSEIIELETMKAVSHYSLNDETSARKSFIEILKLDRNYSLDPAFISPKIISLFENTKKDFNQIYADNKEENVDNKTENENLPQLIKTIPQDYTPMLKSMVIPGWGQLSKDMSAKNWLITAAGVASLGSMIYYIIDANDKEKDYLNETDPLLIQPKYESFNSSYKTRNTLIAAYAAVWLFAQLDLIIFDSGTESIPLSISSGANQRSDLTLSFKMGF